MAEKESKETKPKLDEKKYLEVCRQQLFQNQFWAQCKEVLEASVEAEAQLAAKQKEIDAGDKLIDEVKKFHADAVSKAKAEAETLKGQLQEAYERHKAELTKSIELLQRQENDLKLKQKTLEKENDDLDEQKLVAMNSLKEVQERARMETENFEKEAASRKSALEAELEEMRRIIRSLRAGVERLPA
jgi:hypothetical protein